MKYSELEVDKLRVSLRGANARIAQLLSDAEALSVKMTEIESEFGWKIEARDQLISTQSSTISRLEKNIKDLVSDSRERERLLILSSSSLMESREKVASLSKQLAEAQHARDELTVEWNAVRAERDRLRAQTGWKRKP